MKFDVSMKKDDKAGTAILTVTVPQEELQPYKERTVGIHAKEGEVPGFRKGKAPRPRLIAHFGDKVIDEFALRLLACEATEEAMKNKKVQATGRIHIDLTPVEENKPIEFTATCTIAEAGEEAEPELPWPRVGVAEMDDDERSYGPAPAYLRRKK